MESLSLSAGLRGRCCDPPGLRPAPSPTVLLSESFGVGKDRCTRVRSLRQNPNSKPPTLYAKHPQPASRPHLRAPYGQPRGLLGSSRQSLHALLPQGMRGLSNPPASRPPKFHGVFRGCEMHVWSMSGLPSLCSSTQPEGRRVSPYPGARMRPVGRSLSLCFCPTWGKCEIPRALGTPPCVMGL